MNVQSGLHLCRQNIKQVARVSLPLRGFLQRELNDSRCYPDPIIKKLKEQPQWMPRCSLLFSLDSVCFLVSSLLYFFAFYYFFFSFIYLFFVSLSCASCGGKGIPSSRGNEDEQVDVGLSFHTGL